ncbi:META domain-containing protein [Streptomyces sp. NBC_00091]|uniref:META domain-containing protein n=1 Tax=Streptomyces sp. NBC_00091 TaxID=2975648 RepID=UPI00225183AA|nr:META domain-containing protein [Streptomyces sp. NBC_00091]MCX5377023.1 META domain-containing protein [Streptomyces sp. NBC_00091]
MRTLRHLTTGSLVLVLALTACGGAQQDGPDRGTAALTVQTSTTPPVPDAPLTVTTWTVATVAGLTAPEGREARFTLTPDGQASGTLGCNRFNAPATVDGPTVTLGLLTSTRMACEGPAGEVERALTTLFAAGPLTWKIQDRTLTLTAPDGSTLTARGATAVE